MQRSTVSPHLHAVIAIATYMSPACSDARDILTIDICEDTLDDVMAVNLLIRRPQGFAPGPDVTLMEGAYIIPLEQQRSARRR